MNSGSEHELAPDSEWDAWMARHTPALLLFARQQSGCEADAQDLVQDAVVESWRKQRMGNPPQLGLVYATIRRRAIDLARSRSRRADREVAAQSDESQFWFDSDPEERERTMLIQKAMSQLQPIYREVVTLKVWGGLTYAEIATALEIPANTAASRYRYGLIELRKLAGEVFA